MVLSCVLQTVTKLKDLYAHPDDVDLLVGGMAEQVTDDGVVGFTFRCIIGEQMLRTKKGDRFFYDVANQPSSFTEGRNQHIVITTFF
jgi:peroxidase